MSHPCGATDDRNDNDNDEADDHVMIRRSAIDDLMHKRQEMMKRTVRIGTNLDNQPKMAIAAVVAGGDNDDDKSKHV